MNIVLERGDVRFTEHGHLENGVLDCRMQVLEPWAHSTRWKDAYLFDNQDQMEKYASGGRNRRRG